MSGADHYSAADHYDVLGVTPSASAVEIKAAHRRHVRLAHPDLGGDVDRFQRVQQAYETLIDPAARARHDRTRPAQAAPADHVAHLLAPPQWTSGPCWLCVRRAGQPLLRITLERAASRARTHVVDVPCCDSCWSRYIVFGATGLVTAAAAAAGAAFLMVVLVADGLSPDAIAVFAGCGAVLLGCLALLWRGIRRRTAAARSETAARVRDRIAGYPPISTLLKRGYRITVF